MLSYMFQRKWSSVFVNDPESQVLKAKLKKKSKHFKSNILDVAKVLLNPIKVRCRRPEGAAQLTTGPTASR